jgi:hypothetical protein
MVFKTAEDNAHVSAMMEKTAMRSIVIGLIKILVQPALPPNQRQARGGYGEPISRLALPPVDFYEIK